MKKILIIGGDAAGMSAAEKIRRLQKDYPIQVLEMGSFTSYGACGIPYFLGGKIESLERLISRTPEEFGTRDIKVYLKHQAQKILPQENLVLASSPEGEKTFSYDKLLLATGASPIIPPIPGRDLPGVFALRGLEEARSMDSYLKEREPKRIAIVGGGYIGLEMAESFVEKGFMVDIFEMADRVLLNFHQEFAEIVKRAVEEKGATLHLKTQVQEIIGTDRVTGIKAGDKEYPCDLVLLAIGVKPNTTLARETGIKTGVKGAIVVNKRLETSIPNIYAAGDAIETRNLITNTSTHIPLALTANRSGSIAGENMAGYPREFRGILGTAALKVFHLYLARTGLSVRDAEEAGFQVSTTSISSRSRAGYYPGGHPIQVYLLHEKKGGRILGGELLGGEEVGSKIDVLATAITGGMKVEDFFHLDLAYAPPIGPVWDPLLTAARVAMKS